VENKIIELLQEVLELDEGSVKLSDKFRDYDEWDSLAYLGVIAEIDDEFDIVIPRDKFQKLLTVQDLINYIRNDQ
jgi:acyl carrier protein